MGVWFGAWICSLVALLSVVTLALYAFFIKWRCLHTVAKVESTFKVYSSLTSSWDKSTYPSVDLDLMHSPAHLDNQVNQGIRADRQT